MKIFAAVVKYIVIPGSSVLGLVYGFDMYIIQRANTVVQPLQIKVESQAVSIEEIKIRTRNIEQILMSSKK